MTRLLLILVGLLFFFAGPGAEAQDPLLHPAKIGITAGTGVRLHSHLPYLLAEDLWAGIILHIVRAVAVRPSLVFYKLDGEDTNNLIPASSTSSADGGLGIALGAFYFSRPKRNFMLYVGPEAKYYFSSEMDFFDNGDKNSETYTHQPSSP